MLGYNLDPKEAPVGWGHICCDGTVANLESVWLVPEKLYSIEMVTNFLWPSSIGLVCSQVGTSSIL